MKTKPNKLFIFIFILSVLLSTPVTKARAHPVDIYAQTLNIMISQTGLQIIWDVKPGPMLTSYLWYEADADQNGTLTQQEMDEWGSARASQLTATLNDKPLPLLLDSVKMPADLQNFQSGQEFIIFTLSAEWPQDATNIQRLFLDNELEQQKSINWYYLSTTGKTAFLLPIQKKQIITIDIIKDRELITDQSKLLASWDSGTPVQILGQKKDVVTETAEQVVPELAKNSPQEILLNLLRTENFSVLFYLFALGISLALGALHALTPGHGKTVVAAYLVGSRGTTWHAIVLGSVVTLTHTGSVLLLGIITLAASQYILPTSIIPWLEVFSGLMIVGLGLYLFWQRYRQWRGPAVKPKKTIKNISVAKAKSLLKIQDKTHDHSHPHSADHKHGHDHSHEIPEAITWRSLITLGISGGLVPCPDAIAILLVAIAINRIVLGLALIISFSLGLAVVLIVIGLLMVNSSRLFTRMDAFNKFAPIMPIVSAGIVLFLGFGLTYGAVTKLAGSTFLSVAAASQTSVNEAQIIYLNADENDHKQLFSVDTKGDPRKLTNAARGVIDFAISPDQKQVIYIEQTEELEYAFWLMNADGTENRFVASCKEAECGQPVWSPDGQRVVYEYMAVNADETTIGISSLWWFDVASGEAKPVFQEDRLPGINPRWSPNGEWLSYATPEGLRLYHLESGENRMIKNTLRAAAQWSPDGKSILLRDVVIRNDQFVTQLFLYDLSSESITNLSADENMENILAAWSPDGKLISVVRRDLSNPRGDQIWLMRADGSDARAVTDAPAVLHGNLNWSPDGKYLLYDLYLLDTFPIESRMEMLNIKTGEVIDLKAEGYNPKWVWPK